jgi:hypothetical protein
MKSVTTERGDNLLWRYVAFIVSRLCWVDLGQPLNKPTTYIGTYSSFTNLNSTTHRSNANVVKIRKRSKEKNEKKKNKIKTREKKRNEERINEWINRRNFKRNKTRVQMGWNLEASFLAVHNGRPRLIVHVLCYTFSTEVIH